MQAGSICDMKRIIPALALFAASAAFVSAQIIPFDLAGNAGVGLLAGNENHVVNGSFGSGGEVGAGISYDSNTLLLTINIAWGSGNGFTDLTGTTTGGHIHGVTASSAPASFLENAGVQIGLNALGGWNSSATNGGFSGTVALNSTQATALMNGQLYINVHTSTNAGGEIRGQLIAVPEPSTYALIFAAVAFVGVAWQRRYRAAA